MSRILAAWEMGANMGHIDRLLMTARALRARGHEVVFALRDLSRAHGRVAAEGFAVLQAPVWLPRLTHPPRLGNYANVLAAAGWLDAPGLAGLLGAWRQLLALVQPQVLICDHAPTALLASRGWPGLAVWAIGNSFEVPPPGPHFPSMLLDDPADNARCPQYDAALLAPANQALALLGLPPLARLTDLFAHAHPALASVPELGHYSGYPEGTCWAGPSYVGDAGVAPQWPAGEGPRAFVYLSPTHVGFRPLVEALHAQGVRALVHAKGLSAEAAARLAGEQGRVRFEPQPVQVDPAVAQADVVVSHASLGLTSAALVAGKPQLVLPTHAEQGMVARRVVHAGIGLALPVRQDGLAPPGAAASSPPEPLPLLRRLLAEPTFARAAQALAQRHAGATPARTAQRLADLIEAAPQSAAP
jgi:UDP:flavonoid glycosyltransferase YjiC (YdhE family)